jgi:hypothetical protein
MRCDAMAVSRWSRRAVVLALVLAVIVVMMCRTALDPGDEACWALCWVLDAGCCCDGN